MAIIIIIIKFIIIIVIHVTQLNVIQDYYH